MMTAEEFDAASNENESAATRAEVRSLRSDLAELREAVQAVETDHGLKPAIPLQVFKSWHHLATLADRERRNEMNDQPPPPALNEPELAEVKRQSEMQVHHGYIIPRLLATIESRDQRIGELMPYPATA